MAPRALVMMALIASVATLGCRKAPPPAAEPDTESSPAPGPGSGRVDVELAWLPGSPVPPLAHVRLADPVYSGSLHWSTGPDAAYARLATSRDGHGVSFRGVPAGTYDLLVSEIVGAPKTVVVAEGERKTLRVDGWYKTRLGSMVVDARDPTSIEIAVVHGLWSGARRCIADSVRLKSVDGLADAASKLARRSGAHQHEADVERDAIVVLASDQRPDVVPGPADPTLPIVKALATVVRPMLGTTSPVFDVTVVDVAPGDDPFGLANAERPDPYVGCGPH